MLNSIDFWDHYAAKRGIVPVTEDEEFDEMLAELLASCSHGEDMEPDLPDQPDWLLDEAAPYNEQEEVDRLLAEREELELQRKIDADFGERDRAFR